MKDKKVVVESVVQHSKQANVPTLLKFSNGELAVTTKDNARFCLMADSKKRKSAMVLTNEHVYHGAVHGTSDELTDLYLCVRDKSTNKMRIVPIEQASLSNNIYNELKTIPSQQLSKKAAFNKMLKEFGGRQAKRYLAQTEHDNINVDLVKSEVDNTVNASIITEDKGNVDTESQYETIRPKFKKDATTLSEVYKIEDVVPATLIYALNEEAVAVFNTAADKLPIKSKLVLGYIKHIQKCEKSKENMLKLKLAIYLDCLLNLITAPVRAMKTYELSRITTTVEIDVRTRFCDQQSQDLVRSAIYTEKALCYAIVLALLISDNYEVNIAELSRDMQTNKKKVLQFAQIVNARLKTKTDLLTLRLPSKVPPLRASFVRKRK